MTQPSASDSFYEGLPVFTEPGGITDIDNYRPVPDDWCVVSTDIVRSTEAVAAGRYKVVNTAGASVISAVANHLKHREFPFVFGGDGAALALPGDYAGDIRDVLARVCAWTRELLDLELRAAVMPVSAVRAAGHNLLVARFRVAEDVSYAMFAGGGLAFAEAVMKSGQGLIEPAPAGARPDLTGLSCRWQPMPAQRGTIMSVLAVPAGDAEQYRFMRLSSEILALAGADSDASHPLPIDGPRFRWPPAGLSIELAAQAPDGGRLWRALHILGEHLIGWWCDKTGRPAGSFSAEQYRRDLTRNSDFRKFDDGLKLTLDVDTQLADRIEAALHDAEQKGICVYGLHRQSEALVTCIVPSPTQRDHIHFVDGAGGGYVAAAKQLKAKL